MLSSNINDHRLFNLT